MSRSVPPSSSLPNILEGIGLEREQAAIGITEATRQHLREQGLTLGAPLGKPGAYGGVFSAEDSMRRSLAVKIVKNPQDREARKRHQRECQVLSSSEIPSDLRPYCFAAHKVRAPEMAEFARDAADGVQPYLVMSRIQGQEVHHYVSERQIPMADRIVLAERFFVALHRLHECGIVHGDISPRNVLIEKDHQVRFVDFGSARDINKAIRSMQSTLAVGGTPGYAPAAQLTGEEQASIRTDIRAAMAVSFDALTGELHQESLSVADKRQRLQAAGVPSGIIRIILKGLRESDSALTNDPKVYSSAREVVDALQAWARNRTRVRQAAVVVPMLVAACVAIVLIWWRLEAEVAERQWQTVRVLKEQIDPVARRESLPPNIRSLIDQADTEMRSVAEKQQELTPIERRQRLDVAADGLRRALDKVRQLDSMLPRMNTLGTMREKIQWQVDAWGLSKLKTDLEQEWLSLNKKLNQGEVEEARPKVDAFANRLVSAWEANERARTAALRRSELTRLLETVPGRLKETPRHKDLQGDASRADDQWNMADSITAFELTEKTYSSLQQTISTWLEKEETAEEKVGRNVLLNQHPGSEGLVDRNKINAVDVAKRDATKQWKQFLLHTSSLRFDAAWNNIVLACSMDPDNPVYKVAKASLLFDGIGVVKNEEEAAKVSNNCLAALLAIEPKTGDVYDSIGSIYYRGLNVNKDPDEAFKWHLKGAQAGFTPNMIDVAMAYHLGKEGFPKDEKKHFSG